MTKSLGMGVLITCKWGSDGSAMDILVDMRWDIIYTIENHWTFNIRSYHEFTHGCTAKSDE